MTTLLILVAGSVVALVLPAVFSRLTEVDE